MKNLKIYNLLPIIGRGEIFAAPKETINVFAIKAAEGHFNIYIEQTNGDLKFVTGLGEKENGEKITEKIVKKFADAAAFDELYRRTNDEDDDSVEYYETNAIPKTKEEYEKLYKELVNNRNI